VALDRLMPKQKKKKVLVKIYSAPAFEDLRKEGLNPLFNRGRKHGGKVTMKERTPGHEGKGNGKKKKKDMESDLRESFFMGRWPQEGKTTLH